MAIYTPPRIQTILSEPFQVPDVFVTGMEQPFVHMDFVRLIFWTDHPPVFGGEETVVERHIACKLVMTNTTFRVARKIISQTRNGG